LTYEKWQTTTKNEKSMRKKVKLQQRASDVMFERKSIKLVSDSQLFNFLTRFEAIYHFIGITIMLISFLQHFLSALIALRHYLLLLLYLFK
jgi:hypothetical protein